MLTKTGSLPKLLVQELVNTKSDRIVMKTLQRSQNKKLPNITELFQRVQVDGEDSEYVSCRSCDKLYMFSTTKANILLMKKLEMHDCYIKNAEHIKTVKIPRDEKDCLVISLREPQRLVLKEKVKNEPHLHYLDLDGVRAEFVHCTKCLRYFGIDSLNMSVDRIHRCHKAKTSEHTTHFKKKLYQCDLCQEIFKSEHFLEIHRRKSHGQGSATVMCSHCGKEFPTERLAKKHELHIHYPELSKKFACTQCDASFHDRSKLRLHALKHSTIKPYVCEQCGKGFNWLGSFQVRFIVTVLIQKFLNKCLLQDHMDMHNGVKKYSCDFCQKSFNKRNTLNNHKRLHTGIILMIFVYDH